MKVEGLTKLVSQLRAKAAARLQSDKVSVAVGYTQPYAIFVHENLEAKHAEGKQAKFLEGPARELVNNGELGRIVTESMKGGATLAQGLVLAGLRIQRESQKVVPVEFGALKGSAFTRLEKQ